MKSRINREAREISISELWWYVVSKWKWLVIGMVVGALLFGAYGAYSAYRVNKVAKSGMASLTMEEQNEVKEVLQDYKLYVQEVEKINNSYLMNLDYYDIGHYLLTYYIEADKYNENIDISENYASNIVSVYKTYIHSEEVHDKIMGLGIEGLQEVDLTFIYYAASDGDVLKIILEADDNWSSKILDAISNAIEEYHSDVEEIVGEHNLIQISADFMNGYSDNIKNGQIYKQSVVSAMMAKVEEKKLSLNERQTEVYLREVEMLDENDSNKNVYVEQSLLNVKYILLGLVGGVIATVILVAVLYIVDKRIKSISEIKQVYNVEILGCIVRDGVSQRYLKEKINKIKTAEKECEQKEYIVNTIISKCKKEGIKELTICSSVLEISEIVKDITKKLSENGISSNCVREINYNNASLTEITNAGNVIIAEMLNRTIGNNLEAEIETCDRLSVNIMGMLVIV